MKLILSKDGVKREIETPFAICCNVEELGALVREINAVRAGMLDNGSTFGWMRIDPSHPCDAAPNTKPRPWTD